MIIYFCWGLPQRRCGCVAGGSCVHSLFQLERLWERGTGCQHDPHVFYWSFSLVLRADVQIPSCGSMVLCCHSHPGAFEVVLLSAAPQIHHVHPTQHVYKHAAHSLEWGCSIQFASQWLGSRGVCWGAYFTHQELLQIFQPFLSEAWGRTWPAKNLGGKGLPALLL